MKETLKEILESSSGPITLVTHSGQCHSDDVYSAALLALLLEKTGRETKILRTRDQSDLEKIEGEYIVFDVFDSILDHHKSQEINGDRNHRRPLAALGLIWRWAKWEIFQYMEIDSLCWRSIDNKFIYYIDKSDNQGGLSINPASFIINHLRDSIDDSDEAFNACYKRAIEDWKSIFSTEKKISELRPIFDSLPVRDVNGKKFKVSINYVPPVGDLTGIDGIIWKTDKGLKIRLLGDNKLSEAEFEDPEDLIFQNKNWLAEVKKVENLFQLKIN